MASPAAIEFLTKQIAIEKEIVTFRWLSRALSIHVNVAKNELAAFHASCQATDEPVHATFLLTGDIIPVKATGSYRDENEMEVEDDQVESVSATKLVLVNEDDLEAAKKQFTRLSSVHVYSLSPSAIKDAALLAPTAERVRPDDISKGRAYNQMVGIVVSPDVKVGRSTKTTAVKPVTTITTNTLALSSKSKLSAGVVDKNEKPKSADKGKEPEKVKPEEKKKKGTLDWSKAKTKVDKVKEAATIKKEKEVAKKESKAELKETVEGAKSNPKKQTENSEVNVKTEKDDSKMITKKDITSEKPKRGTKRPSAVMSLSDSDESEEDSNPAPKTKPRKSASPLPSTPAPRTDKGVKVKKGVLLSDDEDDDAPDVKSKPGRWKGKGRVMVSDDEDADRSVRAMMDLDDSEVNRHNRPPTAPDHRSDDEDVEMLSDSEPVVARPKQKRKPKKVIPLGSNGLPKKRVVKSRKSKNARGFMVTEDYSSYESVSESEQVPAPSDSEKKSQKSRKKPKKESNAASAPEKTASSIKAHSKPRTSTKSTGDGEESPTEQSKEAKPETKKPGSDSGGGGSKPAAGAKGSKNITNYFAKK